MPFINRVYDNPKKWFEEDKPNYEGNFPNLPYLYDKDFHLTESNAIAHYLINKANR